MEKVLLQAAEGLKLLQSLQTLKEGALKGLEQQIMAIVFSLGRRWMQQGLTASASEAKEPGELPTQAGLEAAGQDHL